MNYRIDFPNLGIHLKHVGIAIHLGDFTIAYYGIVIAIGMVCGVLAIMARAKEEGQDPDFYFDLSIAAMLMGIVGARVYYVVFSWDDYKGDLLSIFDIRGGGLAIYGGIIFGGITVFLFTRYKRVPFMRTADICAIGIPIGQIFGRWGNFFNREAFGAYTNNLFAMRLPVSMVRYNEISEKMLQHAVEIDGAQYIQVHPAFFYEGMWNCLVVLVIFLMRKKKRFDGELFLIYVFGYGFGRFYIERLRTDQLLIEGTSVPVSMAVSAAAILISTVLMIRGRMKAAKNE